MHARQGGSFQSLCGNQTSRWRPAPTLYAAIEATAQACVCADELDFSECPIVLPPLLDVLLRTPLRGRVRKIDLSFGTDISNASILRFARECEALIELILPEHPPSTPDFYRSLAQARPTLKNLDLGYKLLESRGGKEFDSTYGPSAYEQFGPSTYCPDRGRMVRPPEERAEVAAFFGAEPAEESGEASEDDSDESESDGSVPEFLYAFRW